MTLDHSLAIGLMAALPVAALAQRPPYKPDPLDGKNAVPAATYESAFADYVPAAGADDELAPDKRWRAANATLAEAGGHAGHHGDTAPNPSVSPAKETQVDHSNH